LRGEKCESALYKDFITDQKKSGQNFHSLLDSEPSRMEKAENSVDTDNSSEGTYHQLALGAQPKRKHFFSPLDPAYADAVHKDAEAVEYTEDEEVCFSPCYFSNFGADDYGREVLRGRSIERFSLW